VSVGLSAFPAEGILHTEDILKAADVNMYKAKRSGKNRVVAPDLEDPRDVERG